MAARSTNKVDENKCRWLLKYSEWRSGLAHTSSKKDARYDRNKAKLANALKNIVFSYFVAYTRLTQRVKNIFFPPYVPVPG